MRGLEIANAANKLANHTALNLSRLMMVGCGSFVNAMKLETRSIVENPVVRKLSLLNLLTEIK